MKNSNLLKLLALTGIVVSLSACFGGKKSIKYTDANYSQIFQISEEEDDDSFVLEGQHLRVKKLAFAGYYGARAIGQFIEIESCQSLVVDTSKLNGGLRFADSLGYDEEDADLGPYDVFQVEGTLKNERGLAVLEADKVERVEKAVLNAEGTGLDAGELLYSPTSKNRGSFDYWSGRKNIGVAFRQVTMQLVTVPTLPITADTPASFKAVFPGERTTNSDDNLSLIDFIIEGLCEDSIKEVNTVFEDLEPLDYAMLTFTTDYDDARGGVCARISDPWLLYRSGKMGPATVNNVFQTMDDALTYAGKTLDVEPLEGLTLDENAFSVVVDNSYMGNGYAEGLVAESDSADLLLFNINTDDSDETWEALADALLELPEKEYETGKVLKWTLKAVGQDQYGNDVAQLEYKIIESSDEETSEETSEVSPVRPLLTDGSESESESEEEKSNDPEDVLAYIDLINDGTTVEIDYYAQLNTWQEFSSLEDGIAFIGDKLTEDGLGFAKAHPDWESQLEATDLGTATPTNITVDWTQMNQFVEDAEIYLVTMVVEFGDYDTAVAAFSAVQKALYGKLFFQSKCTAFRLNGWYNGLNNEFISIGAANVEMTALQFIFMIQDGYFISLADGANARNVTSFADAIAIMKAGFACNYTFQTAEAYADFDTVLTADMLGEGTFNKIQVSFTAANAGAGILQWNLIVINDSDLTSTITTWLKAKGFVDATEAAALGGRAVLYNSEANEYVRLAFHEADPANEDDVSYTLIAVTYCINPNYVPTVAG